MAQYHSYFDNEISIKKTLHVDLTMRFICKSVNGNKYFSRFDRTYHTKIRSSRSV